MVKKTFKELVDINVAWQKWIKENPKIENTKFGYAVNRFLKKSVESIFDAYNFELVKIRIDYAATDPATGVVLTADNPRGFQYDKNGLKKLLEKEKEIEKKWFPKIYEVEPYICETPPDLSDERAELFKGVIIK